MVCNVVCFHYICIICCSQDAQFMINNWHFHQQRLTGHLAQSVKLDLQLAVLLLGRGLSHRINITLRALLTAKSKEKQHRLQELWQKFKVNFMPRGRGGYLPTLIKPIFKILKSIADVVNISWVSPLHPPLTQVYNCKNVYAIRFSLKERKIAEGNANAIRSGRHRHKRKECEAWIEYVHVFTL